MMARRFSAWQLVWVAMTLTLLALPARGQAPTASAGEPPAGEPPAAGPSHEDAGIEVSAGPVLGRAAVSQSGWVEVVVRIANRGSRPASGQATVRVVHTGLGTASGSSSTRSVFHVAPGAQVSLHLPARLLAYDEPVVTVRSSAGKLWLDQPLAHTGGETTVLVDVARASALGSALRGVPVGSRNSPWSAPTMYGSPSALSTIDVSSPSYEPLTGDAVLPRFAAGYARAATVLLRSDELVRQGAAELEALSAYLMGGGTLAVIVARPEDLRHPTLEALIGGEAHAIDPATETLAELVLVRPRPTGGAGRARSRRLPRASAPEPAVAELLHGYTGGNLHPSAYGASASYGLGEVHLLAFDVQQRPAVDSPWVHVRLIDLLRRANERRSSVLFPPGHGSKPAAEIRRLLDPNEGSRWAIMLAALLLCLHAVVAGPVNYTYWRKRHRPIAALAALPLFSLASFAAVVLVGVSAKGCSGRSRRVTVAELGAGMGTGTARRWRGFIVPSATTMGVTADRLTTVLGSELLDRGDEIGDSLSAGRDGLRLVGMQLRPWDTHVVREDSQLALGQGVALIERAPGETVVVNRSGRRLRGLVLYQPSVGAMLLEQLDDGSSASSKRFAPLPLAVASAVGTTSPGSTPLPLLRFDAAAVGDRLDEAAPGLGDAWTAITQVATGKGWFSTDVPVLLAQAEGGTGEDSDSGLTLDRDRLLIRVVGYGGRP